MKKLILAIFLLFIVGCSSDNSKDETIVEEVKSETIIDKGANILKESVDSVAKNSDIIKNKIDEVAKSSNELLNEDKEITSETIDKVTEKMNEVKDNIAKIEIDAKTIFSACASCHGQNGEKKALNVSNIIAGQNRDELISKMNGYKDGTYGGNMKGVMASQMKLLSSQKIEALAEYISKL